MIKDLIKDLAYEKIDLIQGLTRAKLIAHKLTNNQLKEWISKEVNGYSEENDELPDYRKIPCDIYAELFVPFGGGTRTIPFEVTNLKKTSNINLEIMNVTQSISTLYESVNNSEGPYGVENLPQGVVSMFRKNIGENQLVGVNRRVQFSQLRHIIDITKNKLIDTLLELDSAFPNMEDDFKLTEETKEIAKTIINNNIYGQFANSNIGLGDNTSQSISTVINKKIEKTINELKELGIPEDDLNELKTMVEKESNKPTFGKKLINWAAKVSSKAIEKGIELQVPVLLEKVQELM
jgi:predicted DNA-binding protein